MDGPIISAGSLVSRNVSFSDALIFVKHTLSVNVGDASFTIVPMYLFESHFDCDDKRG